MAKRSATDTAERIEAAKIMEDGHPDPTRLGFWATVDEICKLNLQDHYTIYGYRTEPEHVKEQDPASTFTVTPPITIADIAAQYGGYRWMLYLNRRVDGKSRKIHEIRFEIKEPPIPQPHEQFVPAPIRAASVAAAGNATSGAANDQLFGMLSKMVDDLRKDKTEAEAAGREFNPADALNRSVGLLETAYKKSIETGDGPRGNNNELLITMMNNQSAQMIALINAMGQKKEDSVTTEIIKNYFAERNAPKPSAEETGVSTAIALIREIRSEFGRSGGGKGGADYADVLMRVADKLPEAAEKVSAVILRASAAPGAPTRPALVPIDRPAAVRPAGVESIARNPAPAPGAVTNAAPIAPALAGNGVSPESSQAADLEQAQKFLWTLIKGKLVQKLTEGAEIEGDSAGTEAAFVCNEISPAAARIMARTFRDIPAHPEILEDLKKDAILRAVFDNPRITEADLMQFATDYVEWFGDELDDAAASPEAAPPPAPAAAPAPETAPAGASA